MSDITNSNDINALIFEMSYQDDKFGFCTDIMKAKSFSELEFQAINNKLTDDTESIKKLTPECDKLDYALAASSGALCGVMDIFLVGKPGESPIGNITDQWFADRTIDFAKFCKWDEKGEVTLETAIAYLEKKFKIPYDQSVGGGIFKDLIKLTPSNHHFKSLGHNPTLLGLFYSILNQFKNTSSFVTNGELITLNNSDTEFELVGNNIPSKLFCGFVNWFGHLISDMSGSSNSKGRGMGIPSPMWSWTNDIIALKKILSIRVSEFNKSFNELALRIFNEGYDIRFQTAQVIPVFVNEIIVRFFYSIRRMIGYFGAFGKEDRNIKLLWEKCEPFSNVTVKRMLTVAHGTFCLVDLGDAITNSFIEGLGCYNPVEFVLRLNIIGIGRFSISLFGEVSREIKIKKIEEDIGYYNRQKTILNYYIDGLTILASLYDDRTLISFVEDFRDSETYKLAFSKSAILAEKRKVQEEKILKSKSDIDSYFLGGKV